MNSSQHYPTKTNTRQMYDRLSGYYDVIAGSFEDALRMRTIQMLAAQPGERVLEIGPGTGRGLPVLSKLVGFEGSILGVDLSMGMIRKSRQRIGKTGPSAKINLICGDGKALPVISCYFDIILMSFTLELFADLEIPLVLSECRRVLRQSGRLGILALSRPNKAGLMSRIYYRLQHQFPHWIDCRPLSVPETLKSGDFQIMELESGALLGLPVDIVTSQKTG